MNKVERHSIGKLFVIEEAYEGLVEEVLPTILESIRQGSGEVLGSSLAENLEIFVDSVCAGLPHKDSVRHLRFYKAVALSNFRFGAGTAPFSEKFDEEVIKFMPQRKTSFMSVDHWEEAYDACMLVRDMDGLKFLATVDEDVFARSNNGTTPHDLSYYRFMAHFFAGGKDTGKLLISAFEEAMKPQSNATRTKFVELVRIPILELMQDFVNDDQGKFNTHLVEALESHKKYFGTKENAFANPGWLSMRILAACALAVDSKGFKIEVESEYIPRWLYIGEGIKGT
jgi:hypothetical protein